MRVSVKPKPGQLLSKRKVLQRAGWTPARLARELGAPDEVETRPGGVAKMYLLQRVESAEAEWETTPGRSSDGSRSHGKAEKRRKRKKSRQRIAPDIEDALSESMLAQIKDGISDEELAETTYSQSELLRRGWTDTLVRDLLGEPHWLAPNPKYPNSGAPMRLWDRQRVVPLERTSVWRERRSKRAGTPPLAPVDSPLSDLALESGWHAEGDENWRLLGSPLFPRALVSENGARKFIVILPPIEGDLVHMWDASEYAAMTERLTGERAVLVALGDSYEKCSQCGCPLAHIDGAFDCPSCGNTVATANLDDTHKELEAVLVSPASEHDLLNAARAITGEFLRLQQSRWLPAHQRK